MRRQVTVLQRAVGNQALLRMLSHSAPIIQTKLTINQPGDRYEQEADRVAEQVMRMPESAAVPNIRASAKDEVGMQRKCACGGSGGDCSCKGKKEKEEGLLHRKEQGASPKAAAPAIVHEVLRSPGHRLDTATRAFFEPRLGYDLSQVRIHSDSRAAESARSVNALAYTVGSNIVFAVDRYTPQSAAGQRLLAHELTHVLQQSNYLGSPLKKDTEIVSADGFQRRYAVQRSESSEVTRDNASTVVVRANPSQPLLSRAWVSCNEPPDCPARETGEQRRAASASLEVAALDAPETGEIVFGFNIGSSRAASLHGNTTWAGFAAGIAGSADRWEILGFTDCEGGVERNTLLREDRAKAVLQALPVTARSKIDRAAAAPMTDCVASNDTAANRAYNRSVVFRRTVTNVTFTPENVTVPRPSTDLCGPDVTAQVSAAVSSTRATFGGWKANQREDACDALDSLTSGYMAWDIVELHNQQWISRGYRPPCASEPTTPHCGSSVQVDQDCYYAGSANYVIFGVMCKLCYDYYYSIMRVNTGFTRFTKSAMLELIDRYKGQGFTGLGTPSANFKESERWALAGYDGWPSASSPRGDRANCSPHCPIPYSGPGFRVNWYPNEYHTGGGR
ncbi:MAG TPA: DUF4157 domain-containing protein [Terriglobales bacterium]|nr:DUF4157 domain-containing protein [Terriglobales bacterium]